jgi:hypothetical protein
MWRQRCALLPLGGRTDEDALDVWEHIACASWLEACPLPGDEAREAARQQAFDDECDYWDSLVFRGPTEEALLWDESAFDVDYSAGYASDSSEDF